MSKGGRIMAIVTMTIVTMTLSLNVWWSQPLGSRIQIVVIGVQIVTELMNLEILSIDNVSQNTLQILHSVKLTLIGVFEQKFGHVHSVLMMRNHLLHEGNNLIIVFGGFGIH